MRFEKRKITYQPLGRKRSKLIKQMIDSKIIDYAQRSAIKLISFHFVKCIFKNLYTLQ